MDSLNELETEIHLLKNKTIKEGITSISSICGSLYFLIKGYLKAPTSLNYAIIYGILGIIVGSFGLIYGSNFLDTHNELLKENNYKNSILYRKLKI